MPTKESMMHSESEFKSGNSDILQHSCSQNTPSEKGMSTSDAENLAFQKWRSSTGSERESLLLPLVRLLTKHAHAVCWGKIPDLQGDHGWIVNEAVYRAIAHEKGFKGNSKFSTWFHRIVWNICNNALKSKQKKGEEVEITDAVVDSVGGPGNTGDSILLEQVEKLGSKTDRQILGWLREGWTQKEIGEKLGISAGLVRARWIRLRKRLRDG
jgi:RNA polymerase sigma factor (sigma-70 family)